MLSNILKCASPPPIPVFVAKTNVAGYTVNRPAGVVAGDLLIAVIGVVLDPGGATPSLYMTGLPTGFSIVAQVNNSTDDTLVAIATKVATGSEPATYTFANVSGGSPFPLISMLAYRKATRVNRRGSFSRNAGSTATAPSMTPTYPGTLLFVAYADRGTASNITISSPPPDMTQRESVGFSSGPSARLVVYEQSPQGPSSTGTRSIVWDAAASAQSILLQITSEPTVAPEFVASATTQNSTLGTNLVIDRPAGTVEGDLMVAVMAANGSLTGGWTDTTFTEAADQGANNPSLRVAYKVAGASEPSNYTFSSTGTDVKAGSIVTYRFASYNSVSAFVTGANPLILTGATAAASQSILLAIGARPAASVTEFATAPVGMTTVVSNTDATAPSFGVANQAVPGGPTGFVVRSTGSATNVAGLLVTLSPTRSI